MPSIFSAKALLPCLLALCVVPLTHLTSGGSREAPAPDPQATPATQTPAPDRGGPSGPETTIADQVEVALTVYNGNLALVRDVRQLSLPSGVFSLRFADVAATVNPATVHLRSLTNGPALGVLEQNYEYDLLEPDKLLRKYIGREVTLVRDRTEGGTVREERVKATLLAYNSAPVWRIGDEIVTGISASQLRFPELPGNLFSRPTLVWMLENAAAPAHRIEASYLAANLSWSADYVLTVGRSDREADLNGWVTLGNSSGTAFRNARLQLIAGDVHRTAADYRREKNAVAESMAQVAAAPAFAREAFSEYHLYTLQRKTTINNNQTKQIAFLNSGRVQVEKRFVVEGQQFYYRNRQHPGSPLKDVVKVFYRFRNEERSGLGVPMPAGTIRVFQADSKGSVQFAGEDRISHTPKDETINIQTGSAFDVVCERKQTDFRRLADDLFEMEFEIALRNRKDSAISVEVNEPIGGDWQMLSASHRWVKTDAWAAQFEVPVASGAEAKLRYRVRARW